MMVEMAEPVLQHWHAEIGMPLKKESRREIQWVEAKCRDRAGRTECRKCNAWGVGAVPWRGMPSRELLLVEVCA